jgi:uncharacterized FAD-dependent dehydrogenase
MEVETVIIGAGPSALPCCDILNQNGKDFLIIDKGEIERDTLDIHNIINGFAGASLYSDGKISFYPSGTNVWKLNDEDVVINGLVYLCTMINKFGGTEEGMLDIEKVVNDFYEVQETKEGEFIHKPYKSVYISMDTRMRIVKYYSDMLKSRFLEKHIVYEVKKQNEYYEVYYQKNGVYNVDNIIKCKNVVCCGGRFMPMFLKIKFAKKVFKRIEMGIRFESDSESSLWKKLKGTDPKYYKNKELEQWRTFCCCREGMTTESVYNGLLSHSGRADCEKTGRSNIGFNYRTYDGTELSKFKEYVNGLRRNKVSYNMKLEEYLKLEEYPHNRIIKGLKDFIKTFELTDEDLEKVNIIGPCIEGCGKYWKLNNNLKIPNESIWICGDASGIFRGLTASIISGYYAGRQIIENKKEKVYNQIRDDISYAQEIPKIIGKTFEALHEIHIFLLPINPNKNEVDKYNKVVEKWNKLNKVEKPMKACYLALEFTSGTVCVMQSARYILSNNIEKVIEECHKDAEFFAENGFSVVREKIESSVYGSVGIPQTREERYETKYFEFHIRFEPKNGSETDEVSEEEIKELIRVSKEFSEKYGIPIPLSYNKSKSLEGIYQRFLNLRFRNIGAEEACKRVEDIKKAIEEKTNFIHKKTISEYVVYDTYVEMDRGWIDF